MAIARSLFDGNGLRDFLTGMLVAVVVVMAFAAGMEVGAATEGATFDPMTVAPMVLGGLAATVTLVSVRRKY